MVYLYKFVVMEWILVSDLPPVQNTPCLFYIHENMVMGKYDGSNFVDDRGQIIFGVTHWAVPEPPLSEDGQFSFTYFYKDKPVLCLVVTGESDYGVHFDGELMAVIEMNEHGTWDAQSGSLDDEATNQIGKRIEDHYA
jgi:hypothetical protein